MGVLHRPDMYVWRVRNVLFSGSGRTSEGQLGPLFGARKRPKRTQILTAETKTAGARNCFLLNAVRRPDFLFFILFF